MLEQGRPVIFCVLLVAVLFFGCKPAQAPDKAKASKQEQDLPITLGGFIKDHPEGGKLEGVCGTDYTRNVLNCDIYNGLLDWRLTEITLEVVWSPYGDEDKRFYQESVSIEQMKTSHVTIRLGMQLPPDDMIKRGSGPAIEFHHWSWLIVGAKGYRDKAKPVA